MWIVQFYLFHFISDLLIIPYLWSPWDGPSKIGSFSEGPVLQAIVEENEQSALWTEEENEQWECF